MSAASWMRWGVWTIGLVLLACQSPTPDGPSPPHGGGEQSAERPDAERDSDLANFDIRFPWPAFQWIDQKLDLSPDHNGSESWADHLGLAGYNDNPIKRRRRAVMNVLTFGLAQSWYDARGLGSPPNQ